MIVKDRRAIPSEIRLQLLVQCGYKCSMPRCSITESLEFHHINKNPNDNRRENVIVLCAVHHHLADIGKVSVKACQLMKQQLPKMIIAPIEMGISPIKQWKPLPNILFNVSQKLLRKFDFPQVGWEAYNDSPYQLKVRIEVHPFLAGRDLYPISDNDINGINPYYVEPKSHLFANGCFSLPQECATSKDDELILEIRATVEDVNDHEKGKHELLPSRWKYVREHDAWSYYPQRPITP